MSDTDETSASYKADRERWIRAALRNDNARYKAKHYAKNPRSLSRFVPVQSEAPAMMAAINEALGDLHKAAAALGLRLKTLQTRINGCTITLSSGTEPMRAWLDRRWPQRAGRRSVEVVAVEYEGVGEGRERVYYLAAHDGIRARAHVVRVRSVGVERTRVVCKVCKEARSQ